VGHREGAAHHKSLVLYLRKPLHPPAVPVVEEVAGTPTRTPAAA
jgi:hypothetical protein